jgi:hypothetical protein
MKIDRRHVVVALAYTAIAITLAAMDYPRVGCVLFLSCELLTIFLKKDDE